MLVAPAVKCRATHPVLPAQVRNPALRMPRDLHNLCVCKAVFFMGIFPPFVDGWLVGSDDKTSYFNP